jgi:DNA-binding GntR family transcriptional regulator
MTEDAGDIADAGRPDRGREEGGRVTAFPGTATIARDSLSAQIHASLSAALMQGEYKPGDRLTIRRLAERFATSATPVREAVMQLVRQGALELRPGAQPWVPDLGLAGYLAIRDTRIPLERLASERAALHVGAAELLALQRHSADMHGAEDAGRWKQALAANQAFHFTIYRASRMPVLMRYIGSLWLLTGPFINHIYPPVRRGSDSLRLHVEIIAALSRRDAKAAGGAVVREILRGSAAIEQRLRGPEAAGATPPRRHIAQSG